MASTPFRLLVEAAGSPRQPYGAAENRIPAANSTELCGRRMPLPACRRSGHVVAPYAPQSYRMYHSALPRHPIILIPTRLAATRLPRKPLADIAGSPMILHVWRRAVAAELGPVVVASGDREIADIVEREGGRAVLTEPALPTLPVPRARFISRRRSCRGARGRITSISGSTPIAAPRWSAL